MGLLKRITRSRGFRRFLAEIAAGYYRLVHATGPKIVEPADAYDRLRRLGPGVVIAMWHGEHFMMPFVNRENMDVTAMISRSGDGDFAAVLAEKLGISAIRASGGSKGAREDTARADRHDNGNTLRRGGIMGALAAISALQEGRFVALTADVPKGRPRVASDGIMLIAKKSGRPIVPVAIATGRYIRLESTWDKSVVNLPFGRVAIVFGDPISVPADADAAATEAARKAVEEGLNRVTARAYAIAERRDG